MQTLNISDNLLKAINMAQDLYKDNLVSTMKSVYDPHTAPHEDSATGQIAFFILWVVAGFLYVLSAADIVTFPKWINFLNGSNHNSSKQSNEDSKQNNNIHVPNGGETKDGVSAREHDIEKGDNQDKATPATTRLKESDGKKTEQASLHEMKRPQAIKNILYHVTIFGAIMFYYYLCDYKKIWEASERSYDRDLFLFLVFLLFAVGIGLTIKPNQNKILNRDQTEEWKGWMQVMFVWYHVFAAKEWYNWIRVYIAAYVWMTGFGNFSFFWIKEDFSLWRMLKMLFRLNFLVIFVCISVQNEYMLYYICPMHTYWFLTVYVFMRVLKQWNKVRSLMMLKFAAYAIFNALIFDIPGVAEVVFRPLGFILGFHEDKFPLMHEWSFRVGLDHWACFIGMLCAYNYPHFEAFLNSIESPETSKSKRLLLRSVMSLVSIVSLVAWYLTFMVVDKFKYNTWHPYSSWIPIICFIVLRNIHPTLRSYHVGMFAWLGKITLETYLSQLHIYLQANAKDLIVIIPGYRLLNFALCTISYLSLSYTLFNLTTEFSNFFLPKDFGEIRKKAASLAVLVISAYLFAYLIQFSLGRA